MCLVWQHLDMRIFCVYPFVLDLSRFLNNHAIIMIMSNSQERILVVEDDPEISDLIARQSLKPLGYQVKVMQDVPMAISAAISFAPDVIIANLNLSGLSGKDFLVALSSQGLTPPVIVIAEKGMEGDVIQAFRLGASDYLSWPIRETEVVAAVERALTQVRSQREREQLARKVKDTNQKLQSRVRELTTIFGVGKAVTSITDKRILFDKIIEGAVFVAEADKGWLLLREGDGRTFILCAQKNLPKTITTNLDQPWDDGISSLVALSGESLSIHGAALKRFKVARLGKSALIVPVKIKKEVVGLMVVVRNESKPFTPSNKTLLEALADYASISLVNVSLFHAVEDRALSLQTIAETSRDREKIQTAILYRIRDSLENPLEMISREVEVLAGNQKNPLTEHQLSSIHVIREQLKRAILSVQGLVLLEKASSRPNLVTVSLVDLARNAISRFNKVAKEKAVTLTLETKSEPSFVLADVDQLGQVFDLCLSNAIQVSTKGVVILNVLRDKSGEQHVYIKDSGPGLSKEDQINMFNPFFKSHASSPDDIDLFGMGMALGREIIKAHGGQLWVESQLGQGATFHFTLKPAN